MSRREVEGKLQALPQSPPARQSANRKHHQLHQPQRDGVVDMRHESVLPQRLASPIREAGDQVVKVRRAGDQRELLFYLKNYLKLDLHTNDRENEFN